MKLKYLLLFIVVFASAAYAPRVFAVNIELTAFSCFSTGLCVDLSSQSSSGATNRIDGVWKGAFNATTTIVHSGSGSMSYSQEYAITFESNMSGQPAGIYTGFLQETDGGGHLYYASFEWDGTNFVGLPSSSDTRTRIISFTPEDHSTTSSPVLFELEAYINEEDLSFWQGIEISYCYQKQPIGIEHCFLDSYHVTDPGEFLFSTTTELENGNYIVNVHLQTSYLGGIFVNPFGNPLVSQYHQFIVGEGTFLGDFFQSGIDEIDATLSSTTVSFGNTCSPLSGNFSMSLCVLGLIMPSTEQLNTKITELTSQAPWGWAFRFYNIMNGTATTSTTTMPVISYTTGTTSMFGAIDIEFDPFGALLEADNIANAAVSDQAEQKTIREIMEDVVRLIVYLMLGFLVIRKLTGLEFEPNPAVDLYADIARDSQYDKKRRYYDQIHRITKQ